MSGAHAPAERARLDDRGARIEQLAEHFDVTDASDVAWDEADDAEIDRPELEQISIRLPRQDVAELKRRARRRGIGYTTLMRMILREHLRNPLTR